MQQPAEAVGHSRIQNQLTQPFKDLIPDIHHQAAKAAQSQLFPDSRGSRAANKYIPSLKHTLKVTFFFTLLNNNTLSSQPR